MNAESGALLYLKNPDKQHYPASIIKLASALYALELAGDRLEEAVTPSSDALQTVDPARKEQSGHQLPSYWLDMDAKTIALKQGETLSFKDLLHAHLIVSACDASNAIAEFSGGSISNFVHGANLFLQRIGCEHTEMRNPHGLHDPRQLTTARDQARIAREALKVPALREIVSHPAWLRPPTQFHDRVAYRSTNQLLTAGALFYPYAIGMKTGWTGKSRHNLIAAAEKDGRTLIAVLLRNGNRRQMFADARKMFEVAFAEKPVRKQLLAAGPQKFQRTVAGSQEPLRTYTGIVAELESYPSEVPNIQTELRWNPVEVPIAKGTKVGELVFLGWEDAPLLSVPLYAQEELRGTFQHRLRRWVRQTWRETIYFEVIAAIALTLLLGVFMKRGK